MARSQNPKTRKTAAEARTLGVGLLSAGAAAIGIGAALLALLLRRAPAPAADGHPAPDLAPDHPAPGPHDRAPDHFRPDPTAPVPPEMRESLRPATGPAPGFAADRGAAFANPQSAA